VIILDRDVRSTIIIQTPSVDSSPPLKEFGSRTSSGSSYRPSRGDTQVRTSVATSSQHTDPQKIRLGIYLTGSLILTVEPEARARAMFGEP
jgi:hypothetical protein